MNDVWVIVLGVVALVGLGFCVYKLFGVATIKKWLLWAVMEAEKELGSGTGQAKLLLVYNWFVDVFPFPAKFISFEVFSKWVDVALAEMRKMMGDNQAIKKLIGGE